MYSEHKNFRLDIGSPKKSQFCVLYRGTSKTKLFRKVKGMKKDIQAISPNPQHENTRDIDIKQEGIGAKYYEINHMKLESTENYKWWKNLVYYRGTE